ncbi:hypothetical protein GYMLUDRAFT_677451 [Collybiopsis luxurians FD-317 M1]|uniref:Uncharacterized protein n=1 Tax=Collybiopsis luxurians FD-317 M1 TaxID=944289 RepID=A0A0D0CLA0_9AGAR|nr:hypothetical protein GYMLUDRAFT_677451 [Collybiopsis luxurians FD-317 M1]
MKPNRLKDFLLVMSAWFRVAGPVERVENKKRRCSNLLNLPTRCYFQIDAYPSFDLADEEGGPADIPISVG